jgi:hypothetical protein
MSLTDLPGLPAEPPHIIGERFSKGSNFTERGDCNTFPKTRPGKLGDIGRMTQQIIRIALPQPDRLFFDIGSDAECCHGARKVGLIQPCPPPVDHVVLHAGPDDGMFPPQIPAMPDMVAEREDLPEEARYFRAVGGDDPSRGARCFVFAQRPMRGRYLFAQQAFARGLYFMPSEDRYL